MDAPAAEGPAADVEDRWASDLAGAAASVAQSLDEPPRPDPFASREVRAAIDRIVVRALAEDLGDVGDITTAATVPALAEGSADVLARADGVVAGLGVIRAVFDQVDPRVEVELTRADGDHVVRGDVIATVSGRLRSLLTGERVALNLLGHLSGIATRTAAFVEAVGSRPTQVRDTRKTTPGTRLLDKAAVAVGGGHNHRVGLYDQVLVKDNHVLAAGGIEAASLRALERSGGRTVQVEVTTLGELETVLELGITNVLLDNFTPEEVRLAVRRAGGRAHLEASGNITLENVASYAAAGVDSVAVGSITHSAPWLDIAMDVRPEGIERWEPRPDKEWEDLEELLEEATEVVAPEVADELDEVLDTTVPDDEPAAATRPDDEADGPDRPAAATPPVPPSPVVPPAPVIPPAPVVSPLPSAPPARPAPAPAPPGPPRTPTPPGGKSIFGDDASATQNVPSLPSDLSFESVWADTYERRDTASSEDVSTDTDADDDASSPLVAESARPDPPSWLRDDPEDGPA